MTAIFDYRGPPPVPVAPLRKIAGRYVQEPEIVTVTDGLEPPERYVCKHMQLRGNKRCVGCGRTKNEIALEEG